MERSSTLISHFASEAEPSPVELLADLTLSIGEPEFYPRLASLVRSELAADSVGIYLLGDGDRVCNEPIFQAGTVAIAPSWVGSGSLEGLPSVIQMPRHTCEPPSSVRWIYDDQVLVCMPLEQGTRIIINVCNLRGSGPFDAAPLHQCRILLPLLCAAVHRHLRTAGMPVARLGELTDRENEIVSLIMKGHCSESIAHSLTISYGTVKIHKRNIYRKLRVSSEPELLRLHLPSRVVPRA